MDYKRIREIKSQSINLTSRMQMLEELHKETMEKIDDVQKVCNHEFIFIDSKSWDTCYKYLQYGKCLICGKRITLTPEMVNLDTNELVAEENIIDVVGNNIEIWNVDCECSEVKSEIEEAQSTFDRLINETNYSRDYIKNAIVEAVKNIKGNTKIK